MKKKWKLPTLSRKGKTLRNFLLALLPLLVIWMHCGWPMPAKLEYRRWLNMNLLGEAEYLDSFRLEGASKYPMQLGENEEFILIGRESTIKCWPRKTGGATLVPVPWEVRYGNRDGRAAVVAADVPKGTTTALLTVEFGCNYHKFFEDTDLEYWKILLDVQENVARKVHRWQKTFSALGEPLKGDAFVFQIAADYTGAVNEYINWENEVIPYLGNWDLYSEPEAYVSMTVDMEAIFYNANGEELGRAALSNQT